MGVVVDFPELLRFNDNDIVDINEVILDLQDTIIQSYPTGKKPEDFKGDWINRIASCAKLLNLKLSNVNPSFKAIEQKIPNLNGTSSTYEGSISAKTTTASTATKKSASKEPALKELALKEPFIEVLKETFIPNFHKLDKCRFWYPDSTERTADNQLVSIEERLFDYGLKCRYLHPIHSFILDLGDIISEEIFTKKELFELQEFGNTLLVFPLEECISLELAKMGEMKNTLEVYDYFRKLDFNPVSNTLMDWLSMSVTNTSFNLLLNERLPAILESGNLYLYWNFLNVICYYSKIQSISKEKSSQANSSATNAKRKLSSVEEITRKAVGRKMDSVYLGADLELGALEVRSKKNDDIKDLSDGYYKLPIVMEDMVKNIADKYPSLRNDVKIIGYCGI